jgi:hypothetical protein
MMVRPALVLERQKEEAVAEVEEAAAVVTDFLLIVSIDTPFDCSASAASASALLWLLQPFIIQSSDAIQNRLFWFYSFCLHSPFSVVVLQCELASTSPSQTRLLLAAGGSCNRSCFSNAIRSCTDIPRLMGAAACPFRSIHHYLRLTYLSFSGSCSCTKCRLKGCRLLHGLQGSLATTELGWRWKENPL